jgi:hypothetical protein
MLSKPETYPEVERWFTDCGGARRGVELRRLSPRSTQALVDELLRRSRPTFGIETVWHVRHEEEVLLRDLPHAGLLAADGQVNLDVVLAGIAHEDVVLPDLGVSVLPSVLAIDAGPKAGWTTQTITGFLGLVADLAALAGEDATLLFVDERAVPLPEPEQERFRSALPTATARSIDVGA